MVNIFQKGYTDISFQGRDPEATFSNGAFSSLGGYYGKLISGAH